MNTILNILSYAVAFLRHARTTLKTVGKSSYLHTGRGLHIGAGTRIWAPSCIEIGDSVYIGKQVHIEANCEIGDFCLLANRVAIVGRHDHDFTAIGYPVRFAPHVGSRRLPSPHKSDKAVIGCDVWLGYGAIVLTGVVIGRGSIVAAGSVVTKDLPPYSIAAGIPARVVGQRFSNQMKIDEHERAIQAGCFVFSERGFDHCVIAPKWDVT